MKRLQMIPLFIVSVVLSTGCNRKPESSSATVVSIDPVSMEAHSVLVMDGKSPIPTISVGTKADGALWVGSFSGDKVGYVEMK